MATSRPSRFPRVPYSQIRWIVGQRHVSDSFLAVGLDVARRMVKHVGPQMQWRPAERREAIRYAMAVHKDNRKVYRAVMRGF